MDKANPSKKTVTSVIATCRESNPRAGKTLGAFFKSIEDFSTIIDWILDFDDPWVADSIEFSHYKLLSSRQAKRLFRIQLRSYGGNKIPVHFRKEILKRLNVREAMQLYIQEGVTFDFGEAIKLF